MGTAITERLLEFGYRPLVWNRSRDKADSLIDRGAIWSDNPILDCDRIIISHHSPVLQHLRVRLRPGRWNRLIRIGKQQAQREH